MDQNYSGVLVIAHGMRDPSGKTAFFQIVDWVREMLPKTLVEGAFLEFAEPTIAEAIAKFASQGATNIAVVPMFLFATGHTMDDVPKAVAEAVGQLKGGSGFRVQNSGVESQASCNGSQFSREPKASANEQKQTISIMPHVGAHQRVVELSAFRYHQSLKGVKDIPAQETLVIIAGHGSPEPEAIEELAAFAARREKLTPVARVVPCFAVLGEPQLADVLMQSALSSYKRIVVQPHLLLRGRYHDMISNQVETFRREYPHIDWIVTEPLGPDRLLAQAVVEIVKNDE